jgi:hypothetical protein
LLVVGCFLRLHGRKPKTPNAKEPLETRLKNCLSVLDALGSG